MGKTWISPRFFFLQIFAYFYLPVNIHSVIDRFQKFPFALASASQKTSKNEFLDPHFEMDPHVQNNLKI